MRLLWVGLLLSAMGAWAQVRPVVPVQVQANRVYSHARCGRLRLHFRARPSPARRQFAGELCRTVPSGA